MALWHPRSHELVDDRERPALPTTTSAFASTAGCGVTIRCANVWEPFADGCTNPWGIDWDDYGQAFIPNTVDPAPLPCHPRRTLRAVAKPRLEPLRLPAHRHHRRPPPLRREGQHPRRNRLRGGTRGGRRTLPLRDSRLPRRQLAGSLPQHRLPPQHARQAHQPRRPRSARDPATPPTTPRTSSSPEDPWFMGVSFRTAPDGTVYFTDWSDTGECHSTRNTRKSTGRIYRLSHGRPVAQAGQRRHPDR